MLWMIQMRELQLLGSFGQMWLVFQFVFIFCIIFPISAFLSLASIYSFLLKTLLQIVPYYVMAALPVIAASTSLAAGNFYVESACHKMSLLLKRCCQAAEVNSQARELIFDSHGSFATLVTFCRSTSADAFSLFGLQITWMLLARVVYFLSLSIWVLSTGLINSLSSVLR
jgi:hypothetical protein